MKPPQILIVDHVPRWQEFYEIAFEGEDIMVEIVATLKDACNRLREKAYSLVVVDNLALRAEQEGEPSAELPTSQKVLVVSSAPTVKEVSASRELTGARHYRAKPYEKATLLELVRRLMA